MSKRLRRFLLVAGVLCVSVYAVLMRLQDRFIVENRTGQTVAWLKVSLYEQKWSFQNIAPGGQAWAAYNVVEMPFEVIGRLDNSQVVKGEGGYLGAGIAGHRDRIILLPDGKVDVQVDSL